MTADKAYLIDASIYFFRGYFALPDNWHSEEGWPTNGVQGYASWLLNLLWQLKPEYVAVAYDESLGSGFRHQLFPDYKANRVLPDEGLVFQFSACRQLTTLLGITHFASNSHEADDIIGSVAQAARDWNLCPVIVSRDKDLAQLLQAGEHMWDFPNGESRGVEQLEAELGIKLKQLPDYLALVGDAVDNIPGVPGIGPKTALALLRIYSSIDEIFANLDQLALLPIRGASGLEKKLAPCKDQLQITRQLTTIACDGPRPRSMDELRYRGVDYPALENFCQHMGLAKGLLAQAKKLPTG